MGRTSVRLSPDGQDLVRHEKKPRESVGDGQVGNTPTLVTGVSASPSGPHPD